MTLRTLVLAVAIFIAMLVLAGCASTAGLSPVSNVQNANQLAAEKSLATSTVSAAAWPADDWWRALSDPQLDSLIDEGLRGSPTLRVAAARTRQAIAFADGTQANLYPRIDADAELTPEHPSALGVMPPPPGQTSITLHQLQLTLNWEIDFWGKNRSAYESALDQAKAAEVDAYAARLALSAAIAQTYVDLQRAYLLLDVAQETLKEREQIYSLSRDRTAAGLDSRLELKQAETTVPATRQRIEQLQENIQLARNQLAALLGEGPDRGLTIARPGMHALAPVVLPSRVPAELIGRRPDVVAQRLRVTALSKDIDSAKAEFYPNINLAAFIGFQSLSSAGFLTGASRMLGAGPAITLPIFDGGRLRGNLAGKDATYDIAVEQYNQLLADAMRDVVDQLTSFRSVDTQRAEQKLALTSAQEAYDLAAMRYREGVGNYLQVLATQDQLLVQRSLDADLRARQLALAISLFRALGGGFNGQPGTTVGAL